MRYCILCGTELILGGNFMASDMDESITDEKSDAMITNATCPNCGAIYNMTDASQLERDFDPTYIGRTEIYIDNEEEDEEQNEN